MRSLAVVIVNQPRSGTPGQSPIRSLIELTKQADRRSANRRRLGPRLERDSFPIIMGLAGFWLGSISALNDIRSCYELLQIAGLSARWVPQAKTLPNL